MFRKKEDVVVSSRSLMRNKDAKILRETLTSLFPIPRGWSTSSSSSATSPVSGIDGLFASSSGKINIELIKYANKMTGYGLADERSPYFIDLDPKGNGRYLPTLHSLWKLVPPSDDEAPSAHSSLYPPLTPTLLVPQAVSSYLIGGADLMLQGVIVPVEGLPPFAAGSLVSIRVIGNPAPLAIGEAIVSSIDCVNKLQMKGKGIRILHHYGDVLWDAGGRMRPNEGFRGNLVVPIGPEPGYDNTENGEEEEEDSGEEDEKGTDEKGLNNNTENIAHSTADTNTNAAAVDNTGSYDAPRSLAAASSSSPTVDNDAFLATATTTSLTLNGTATVPAETTTSTVPSVPYWETLDPTALLEATFLQALRRKIKSSELPLLANVLFGTFMAAVRPKGLTLDPRKSKWKKFDAFLQDMASTGLIAIEEDRSKGNVRLMGIDRNHPTYKQYRPWPASFEEGYNNDNPHDENNDSDNEHNSKSSASASNIAWLPPIVEQYLRPCSAASLIITTVYAVALAKGKGNELPGILVHHGRRRGGPSTSKALGTSLIRLADMGLQDMLAAGNNSATNIHESSSSSAPTVTLNQILGILPPLNTLLLTKTEANTILAEYWSIRKLQDSSNKRNVLLDTPLAGALAGKTITDLSSINTSSSSSSSTTRNSMSNLVNGTDDEDINNDDENTEDQDDTEATKETSDETEASSSLPLCIPFSPDDISGTLPAPKDSLIDAPSLPREDIAKLWKTKMEKWYTITYRQGGSSGVEEIIVKKGTPPIVSIFVKRIMGGKRSTTHCIGPDLYRVDLHDVAKALKKHLAASATVQQAGNNVKVKEIMVQGDEAERLANIIITEFGIPKNCVQISEENNGGGEGGGGKKKGSGEKRK